MSEFNLFRDLSHLTDSTMEDGLTFQGEKGHRISAILSRPDGPSDIVVVLCHGFLSNKNSTTNKTLTRLLNERGIATFRFDFFGQGDSEGRFEDITTSLAVEQTLAAVTKVISVGFKTIGLVGSSFGGLVSILATAQRMDISCLALKCPVVDFAEELRLEFGEQEMARWKATGTIPNITGGAGRIPLRYHFYEDCLHRIAYEPAGSITAPTLIVQGDQDEHVPLHQSRRLYEMLSGKKRLEIVPGADHQFTKGEDFARMTNLIAYWLTEHLT